MSISSLSCYIFCRVKVDLTKYVEEHEFQFDETFDAHEDNEEVFRRY